MIGDSIVQRDEFKNTTKTLFQQATMDKLKEANELDEYLERTKDAYLDTVCTNPGLQKAALEKKAGWLKCPNNGTVTDHEDDNDDEKHGKCIIYNFQITTLESILISPRWACATCKTRRQQK
jgi:phenylalanyl-tRNA synthetase beta subunit